MPRYVAFLRGVMPTNAKMPELRRAFESAGFTNVRTVLGSGNVVFDARTGTESALARRAEAAMQKQLGRTFGTIVRRTDYLQELLEADPFSAHRPPPDAKRVVTFLPRPLTRKLSCPIEGDLVRILAVKGAEAFTIYMPNPRGPVFMTMIKKTFGEDVTTRTWETVRKCSCA